MRRRLDSIRARRTGSSSRPVLSLTCTDLRYLAFTDPVQPMRSRLSLYAVQIFSAFRLRSSAHMKKRASRQEPNTVEPTGPHVFSFAANGDGFLLDGKPFQIRSGELHPARI